MSDAQPPVRLLGYRLRVDPRVPPDEIWFEDKDIIVGRISGIEFPTVWERLWAWLNRPLGRQTPRRLEEKLPRRRRSDVEDVHRWG